jgi:Flp pilus assembly protein TadG
MSLTQRKVSVASESPPFFRRLRKSARRVARHDGGATAVEFALVSLPFLATVFFLAENSYNFFIQSQLESATSAASRSVMIGAAQGSSITESDFRSSICSRLAIAVGCVDRLYLDVRSINVDVEPHLTPASVNRVDNRYCLGGPGQYTVVKVAYAAPVVSSVWQTSPVTLDGRTVRMLRAGFAFRNEPFFGAAGNVC